MCLAWVETGGTCPNGATCRHVAGHTFPITAEMREAAQRVITYRANALAQGKGGGKGRRFVVNGDPLHGRGDPPYEERFHRLRAWQSDDSSSDGGAPSVLQAGRTGTAVVDTTGPPPRPPPP